MLYKQTKQTKMLSFDVIGDGTGRDGTGQDKGVVALSFRPTGRLTGRWFLRMANVEYLRPVLLFCL